MCKCGHHVEDLCRLRVRLMSVRLIVVVANLIHPGLLLTNRVILVVACNPGGGVRIVGS
jgi:hypothetical protein